VRLVFIPQGWEDYTYWQRTDRALVKRINRLLDGALRNPMSGIGKPEALKYGSPAPGRGASPRSTGWSIRCSTKIVVLQARYHYEK
jgi:toxin YoeB